MASARYAPLNDEENDDTPLQLNTQQTHAQEHLRQHDIDDHSRSTSPEVGGIQSITTTIPVVAITPAASPVDNVAAMPISNDTSTNTSDSEDVDPDARVNTSDGVGIATSRARTASLNTLDTNYYPRQRGMLGDDAMRRPSMEDLVKHSFSPATHHPRYPQSERSSLLSTKSEKTGSETARVYSFWRQTRRLWRVAAGEWLITALLCTSFAVVLVVYSRKLALGSQEQLSFNSITTMLTFLLGVNLASSMRSYAKLLRWILLSLCWQPLETFDLTLRCESLLSVLKLAWTARKHKSARLKWMTIAFCVLWFSATLALTLFVGMIGLTYTTYPTNEWRDSQPGEVLIRDWSTLDTGDPTSDLGKIQSWGEQGIDTICDDFEFDPDCVTYRNGYAWRKLAAWNPDDPTIGSRSQYAIGTSTLCEERPVISGGNGTSPKIVFEDEFGQNRTIVIGHYSPYLPKEGGFLALSNRCDDCDVARLVYLNTFLAAGPDNPKAQYFRCNNTLELVQVYNSKNQSWVIAPDEYQFSNWTARMLAGAIGWTGDIYYPNSTLWQPKVYKSFSPVTDALRMAYGNGPISVDNMSDFISSYTIRTIAEQDYNGANLTKFAYGRVPMRASQLNVEWLNAILLLAGIPALQLVACIIVFAVANRAIIKDDSPLSMAKLYYSLLEKHGLGNKACMLKGDELVKLIGEQTEEPMGPMVTYGWKDSGKRDEQWRTIGHLDVYERTDEDPGSINPDGSIGRAPSKVKDIFWGGIKYDGTSAGSDPIAQDVVRRRRHRSASLPLS